MYIKKKEFNNRHTIIVEPSSTLCPFETGQSILEALLQEKVSINHSCGGMGSCGTCRVEIVEGSQNLPDRNPVEKELAEEYGYLESERLSCQTPAQAGLRVKVPQKY